MSKSEKSNKLYPEVIIVDVNHNRSELWNTMHSSIQTPGLGIIPVLNPEMKQIVKPLCAPIEYLMPIERTDICQNMIEHFKQTRRIGKTYTSELKFCEQLANSHKINYNELLRKKNQEIKSLKLKNQNRKTVIADLKFDLAEAKRRIAELSNDLRKKNPDKSNPHPPSG